MPGVSKAVDILREEEREENEEEAGNLEPENPAEMNERTPNSLAESFGGTAEVTSLLRIDQALGRTRRSHLAGVRGSLSGGSRWRRSSRRHVSNLLADPLGGDAHPDAEQSPNRFWLHGEKFISGSRFELPCRDITSKVLENCSAGSRKDPARKWGQPLNSRLRTLIRQLGEAIHESVSESEHIAGVVQDIRKQGFDVLLMLEATIGLNEVEEQPAALSEITNEAGETIEGAPFSTQDVSFLKSLRIAVDGESMDE